MNLLPLTVSPQCRVQAVLDALIKFNPAADGMSLAVSGERLHLRSVRFGALEPLHELPSIEVMPPDHHMQSLEFFGDRDAVVLRSPLSLVVLPCSVVNTRDHMVVFVGRKVRKCLLSLIGFRNKIQHC